jgi:hypothetical protein
VKTPLPEPQRRSLDLSALVNEWPGDLYNVVLIASAESEGAATDGSGDPVAVGELTRVPPPRLDVDLNLKNAAYAIQWWVFGLFAIWMWWKIIRADRRTEAGNDGGGPAGTAGPDAPHAPDADADPNTEQDTPGRDNPGQDAHEEEARV